ncbi:hypothetical protein [Microvirga sp. VF16]|uniref:hypothetical protein n=1 Tax=Microvirga sp. VF16 TaxID=2807101 RepID=UPI00193C9B17|nr:hypothetical protein [Microvirga sp. VF16]QRM36028.1 hypothetical protein JO965_47580 [Microvirga sp. VF16]
MIALVQAEGGDPAALALDPLLAAIVGRFVALEEKRKYWTPKLQMLLPTLEAVCPDVTLSGLSPGMQKRMIRHLAQRYTPSSIHLPMALVSAAVNWAADPDDDNRVQSRYRPKVISSVKQICKVLSAPRPKPRNWHPEVEDMARVVAAFCGNEPMLRWCLIALTFGGRSVAVRSARRSQLHGREFDTQPPDRPESDSKRYPVLPVPPSALKEMRSWPEEEWVGIGSTWIADQLTRVRDKLGLPKLVPGSFRDFVKTTLREAHLDYGVAPVPREQRLIWQGHAPADTDSRYGRLAPDFVLHAAIAMEARLRHLDALSGGALLPHGPAEGEDNWLLRQAAAKARENPLVWQRLTQERRLPFGASVDGSPLEEPDFDGLKAGKTVEIGGVRGTFRQISAKPLCCRLDDIFEPTLGDVIQASGSEVLRLVPNDPGSLVSSPILFVQDQRNLIKQ